MPEKHRIVVIGAGPAGLGAGLRLSRQKETSWRIFEASNRVGGLASSRVDRQGFTWDLGGHVIFSNDRFFNGVVEKALGDDALTHRRSSFVLLNNRFVPFPLQNNIHRLPKKMRDECLEGMKKALARKEHPSHFAQWIGATLGDGLAKHFMLPYNRKVWAVPLDRMGFGWIDGRVSLPPVKTVERAIRTGRDETGWGGNATFRFPLNGGTGGLFQKIAQPFMDQIAFGNEAVKIDPLKKTVTFKNRRTVLYDRLITTAPLDRLVTRLLVAPPAEVVAAANRLASNSGWMVGIGIDRRITTDRCWLYFPDPRVPFYRVTYFSNYSPHNVPRSASQTSLLCEISVSGRGGVTASNVVEKTVEGLVRSRIIRPDDVRKIVTRWKLKLPYSYPIPTLDRDIALKTIERYLRHHGIRSVGRFGGWRYERGNMDHTFIDGHKTAASFLRRFS